MWVGFLQTEVDLSGPGCIRTSRKGKNPSDAEEGCSMVKVRELRKVR